jgi:hypothetical protein
LSNFISFFFIDVFLSTGNDVTTMVSSFDDNSKFDVSKNEIETSRGEVSTLENPFTAYNKGNKGYCLLDMQYQL